MDGEGRIMAKVADFGTARSLAPTIAGRTVDNPIWLAPEVMRNESTPKRYEPPPPFPFQLTRSMRCYLKWLRMRMT